MNMDDNNYVDFEEAQPEKKYNKKTIIIIAVVACGDLLLLRVWWLGRLDLWRPDRSEPQHRVLNLTKPQTI